jgi:hypothetical protein
MTMTAIVPSASAATDRVWLTTGVDTNVSAGTMIAGYVRAAPGEIVTVNWKAGVLDSNHPVQVQFYPSTPAMNWTGYERIGAYSYGYYLYGSGFVGSPPGSAWIRSGGYDVICILVSSSALGTPTVTFNVTVTRDNWTTVPDPNGLDAKLAELNSTVSALQNYTARLNDTLGVLGESMLDNFTALGDAISGIRNTLDDMNFSAGSDVALLRDQLDAPDASLAQSEVLLRALMDMNDTALRALVEANCANLTAQLQRVNVSVTNITNVTNNITERSEYNDTALWDELGRLSATPPVTIVQTNNTTVVNKTEVNPTTFVNRTETLSKGDNGVTAGAVAGVATGAIVSGAGTVMIDRRMRKRYGGVTAPEQN